MAPQPKPGDVIVRPTTCHETGRRARYEVGFFNRPSHLWELTYERALNSAYQCARESNVDVWYSDEPDVFQPFARLRITA
jgi:hypothetical protein